VFQGQKCLGFDWSADGNCFSDLIRVMRIGMIGRSDAVVGGFRRGVWNAGWGTRYMVFSGISWRQQLTKRLATTPDGKNPVK